MAAPTLSNAVLPFRYQPPPSAVHARDNPNPGKRASPRPQPGPKTGPESTPRPSARERFHRTVDGPPVSLFLAVLRQGALFPVCCLILAVRSRFLPFLGWRLLATSPRVFTGLFRAGRPPVVCLLSGREKPLSAVSNGTWPFSAKGNGIPRNQPEGGGFAFLVLHAQASRGGVGFPSERRNGEN